MSLLQPMDQGVIQMFKTHYLQKMWRALSLKCDVSLSDLEKAAQAPAESEVKLQKNMVRCHWQEFTIRDAIWHVQDAWEEVTQFSIRGDWKKLCPQFTVDFKGFDLTEKFSEERLDPLSLSVSRYASGGTEWLGKITTEHAGILNASSGRL